MCVIHCGYVELRVDTDLLLFLLSLVTLGEHIYYDLRRPAYLTCSACRSQLCKLSSTSIVLLHTIS